MPAASWIGLSATTICIVEQFGLAIDAPVAVERLGVDLGDDERDVGSCRQRGGVVDHDGAGARRSAAPTRRDVAAAGGEQRDVEALDRLRR